MKPLNFILGLNIGLFQKIEIALVILGFRLASRIDIYEGNDNPIYIRTALSKAGLKFQSMRTSDQPKHLCGLAIAKTKELAFEFNTANLQGNNDLVMQLIGEPLVFPMKIPEYGTKNYRMFEVMRKEAPTLFLAMVLNSDLIAA